MTLFEAYFFVDWSASSAARPKRPRPDAIWVGERNPEAARETSHPPGAVKGQATAGPALTGPTI
jgi:hypothetical protein